MRLNIATKKDGDQAIWYGDVVEIELATDAHSYYQLAINPSGALVDLDSKENLTENAKSGVRLESLNKLDEDESFDLLSSYGFKETATALQNLQTLHASRQYASLSRQGQTRFDRLIPLLLGALQQVDNVDITFDRIFLLLSNVARRSVYLALLLENPMVLSQLIKLCSASPWIARYLQQFPILLDELMDPRSLYLPPEKEALVTDLRQRLAQLDQDDVELGMDVLRHFKQANVLRVAAADIADALPLMKVSDHLSWIAEIILDEALEQAWRHLVARHGRPVRASEAPPGGTVRRRAAAYGRGPCPGARHGAGPVRGPGGCRCGDSGRQAPAIHGTHT